MQGRSRFRFRYRGFILSLSQTLGSLFDKIFNDEETAGNDNVFYNPSDLTSLRVETDGSGGNPAVGDPVGIMLDTSGLAGSMEEFLGGQTELVTNGTFDTDTDWSKGTNASISGGVATLNVVGGAFTYIEQNISFTVGAWYVVTLTLNGDAGNDARVMDNASNTGALTSPAYDVTLTGSSQEVEYIFQATANSTEIHIARSSAGDWSFTVDNVSVKEIPGNHAIAPSDAARPTLMDDPDTTWSSLTDDGTRGDELFANLSAFADGTDTLSIDGFVPYGTPVLTEVRSGALYIEVDSANEGARFDVNEIVDVEIGSEYEVSFQYSGDGSANVFFNAGITGQTSSSFTVRPTDNRISLFFRVNTNAGAGSGTFSNVSVRKVNTAFDERGSELVTNGTFDGGDITGWTENTGFTLSADNGGLKAEYDGATGLWYVGASQAVTTEAGEWYEVTFDITALDNNTGRIRVETALGGGNELNAGSLGLGRHILKFYASTTTTYLNFSVQTNAAGSATYDNISCRKIPYRNLLLIDTTVPADQDDDSTFDTDTGNWSKGTGWSIGSGVASCDGTQTGNSNLAKSAGFVSNKWYRVRMHITSLSAGGVYINIGGITSSSLYTTTGWVEFIGRAVTNVNLYIQANSTFVGSIDNIIVQELPSTTPTSYYLDCDGTDDWMQVTPTLNLGEQWWHTGAWQSNTDGLRAFATTNSAFGSVRHTANDWSFYDSASALVDITASDITVPHVLTVEQSDWNSLSARFNGNTEVDPITPYDNSGATGGLALFTHSNNSYASGIDGRFYGGAWGQGQVDYDELTTLQDYLGTLVEPDIDPTDVTSYANVYEMLSAQTAAALFDIDDTTSLRVERDGSGGVPVDGDPVGLMMDVSGTGGLTMEAYLEGATELVTNGTFDSDSDWAKASGVTISGGVLDVGSDVVGVPASQSATTAVADAWYEFSYEIVSINTVGGGMSLRFGNTLTPVETTTGTKTGTIQATNTDPLQVLKRGGATFDGTVDNISVKALPHYVATAPYDAARPTLASVLDETASELTDDGTRGDNLIDDFSDIASDWSTVVGSPDTVEVVGEELHIVEATDVNYNGRRHSGVAVEIGSQYEVSVAVRALSGAARIDIVDADVAEGVSAGVTTSFSQTLTFTCTPITTLLRVQAVLVGVGEAYFGPITVRKVNTVFDGRGDELVTNGDFSDGSTGWTGTNWTFSGGVASITAGNDLLNNTGYETAIPAGATVVVEFEIKNYVSGSIRSGLGGGTAQLGSFVSGNGKHTEVFTNNNNLYVRMQPSSFNGSIDNISVKEVLTPNLIPNSTFDTATGWTTGTGWSIGSGVATTDGSGGGATLQSNAGIVEAAKWYRCSMYISANANDLRFLVGGALSESTTSTGWFTQYVFSGSSDTQVKIQELGAGTATIDNVIVQEVPASVARAHYLDFDGVDDNLILDGTDFGSSTNATLYKTFRGDSTDTTQIMFGTNAGPYILAAQSGSTNTLLRNAVGSPVYREDGVIPAYATRGDIFTALIDNTDHTIGVEEANLSANATWVSSGFYIGGEYSPLWSNTGRLYSWAAVDTRLDGRNRDLLENFMISRKTT